MKKTKYILPSFILSGLTAILFTFIYPIFLQIITGGTTKIELFYFSNKNWLWYKYIPNNYIVNSISFMPWILITSIIILILSFIYILSGLLVKKFNKENKINK